MKPYLEMSKEILTQGSYEWNERTETGTLSLFGEMSKYDLREGFPISTTKKLAWRLPFEEMNFFMRGDSDVKILMDKNVNVWNANAFDFYLRNNNLSGEFPKHSEQWSEKFEWYVDQVKNNSDFPLKDRSLGRIYGVQERDWTGPDGKKVDQLSDFLNKLKNDPTSRSNIVSHYNPAEMSQMALGPCHLLYQPRVVDGRLDLLMFQRSCDNLLGVPFNAAQYGYLMELAANEADLEAGEFSHMFGNLHYYLGTEGRQDFLRDKDNLQEFQSMVKEANSSGDYLDIKDWYLTNAPGEIAGVEGLDHIPFALMQLSNEPRSMPSLELKVKDKSIWDIIQMDVRDSVQVNNYDPYPALAYEIDGKTIKPRMAS